MTPMEKQKLRESILLPERMLDEYGNPVHMSMTQIFHLNCYAYSLGVMHVEPGISYNIGFMKENELAAFDENGKLSKEKFLVPMKEDLRELGLTCRQFNLHEEIQLEDGEYLVKWYYCEVGNGDIHFFRKDSQTGIWFHKAGVYAPPKAIGEEPGRIWIIEGDSYREQGYFAIRTR